MSTILCIDTASDRFAVALDRDGSVSGLEAAASQDHSRLLLPAIAALLGFGGQIDGIVVVTGPGAYAGIRVGIATAEGLALAHGCGVFGVGTLEAVALTPGGRKASRAIHPAGRGEFAVQALEDGGPAGAPVIAAPADLDARCIGEGASAFGGQEIAPLDRAEAALRALAPRIRAGTAQAGADAFYLREPNITISRRREAAAS